MKECINESNIALYSMRDQLKNNRSRGISKKGSLGSFVKRSFWNVATDIMIQITKRSSTGSCFRWLMSIRLSTYQPDISVDFLSYEYVDNGKTTPSVQNPIVFLP